MNARTALRAAVVVGAVTLMSAFAGGTASAANCAYTPAAGVCQMVIDNNPCEVKDSPDITGTPPWMYSVDLRSVVVCFDVVVGAG